MVPGEGPPFTQQASLQFRCKMQQREGGFPPPFLAQLQLIVVSKSLRRDPEVQNRRMEGG